MKKQSGFTLIELLLVIAIIGIISAIAVPAFIGQMNKGKDAAAEANCANILAPFMTAIKDKEDDGIIVDEKTITGLVDTKDVNTALVSAIYRDNNPWNKQQPAFLWRGVIAADKFDDAIKALATTANKGQVQLAAGKVGDNLVVGAAVYLNRTVGKANSTDTNTDTDNHVIVKIIGAD